MRIIGAVKRHFFHTATHVFDYGNLSKEMFAIHTWRSVIYSLGYDHKHMFAIFLAKATITLCDLSSLLFCIDATLLCEFESDKIRINEFQ